MTNTVTVEIQLMVSGGQIEPARGYYRTRTVEADITDPGTIDALMESHGALGKMREALRLSIEVMQGNVPDQPAAA